MTEQAIAEAPADSVAEQAPAKKEKQKPARFISKMRHHVINRPAIYRPIFTQHNVGGMPAYQQYTPPCIEFKDGVFVTEDPEQMEFLRNRGDGRRWGMGVDYQEVPWVERQAQIDQVAAQRPVTNEELHEKLKALEAKFEGGDGATVDPGQVTVAGEGKKKAPAKKKTAAKKTLAETI